MRSLLGFLVLAGLFGYAGLLLNSGRYGLTLFVFLPVLLGGLASWIKRPATTGRAVMLGAMAGAGSLLGFLALGLEGLICVVMAAPLAIPLGMLGAWLVFRAGLRNASTKGFAALFLLLPGGTTLDGTAVPPVYEVRTTMEIAAAPAEVWEHLPEFAEMPAPREWFFRTGLAYPTRARMEGSGVGAKRYCDFSTGPVVETIEVWDAPRVLQFAVTDTPAPMRELSPYGNISPKHLHGYMLGKRGRFRLTELANGHTLVEGTSWYQHGLWPAQYWRWWSDAIAHQVHRRVLAHVRELSERR